ncbi:hypothetical protein CPC08DRAFT_714950 [Agrocybe pediades]|nr:hypothetical protein CPC08DRAFT_714950 [Agrocybe pediades]
MQVAVVRDCINTFATIVTGLAPTLMVARLKVDSLQRSRETEVSEYPTFPQLRQHSDTAHQDQRSQTEREACHEVIHQGTSANSQHESEHHGEHGRVGQGIV